MRAREFIQHLKQLRNNDNDQGDVEFAPQCDGNHEIMIPPLQQELEMQKASNGKKSPVITQLLDVSDDDHDEDDTEYNDATPEEKIIIIRTR